MNDGAAPSSPPPPPAASSPPPPPAAASPPPPPAAGAAGAGAGDAPAWAQGAAADTLKLISTKGWKTPDEVATSYANLEAKVAAKGVIVPGEKATPDEVKAFHKAIGVPEAPDKYDLGGFKPPEGVAWDGPAQGKILAAMHAAGATPAVVRAALGAYAEWAQATQASIAGVTAAAAEKAREDLQAEWKGDYDAKLDLANRAVRFAFGEDGLEQARQVRLADGTFLLDSPIIARAFAKLAALGTGDGALPGQKPGLAGPLNLTEAKARRQAIMGDPELSAAATNRGHPRHKAVVDELNQLDEMIAKANARPAPAA